ncbi:Outer membrane lipoprotein carrier protein LolA [Cardinium endosymbiont of Sogatella furcifera]|uniref:LolA family protein n=1 Tax=Cardinium endosymbiont of Sogatella furcifera TaxID=650378 RepID=UPI000E108659|nr:outer membrane lipoprotein carrier protein LolA [Cardinium endosymbiont of Sogatella furcifera]AXI24528.1 Outer membrane lipoprotein carrier protein LolA [Cardinium endosymbiont of Sogatella furcifera]
MIMLIAKRSHLLGILFRSLVWLVVPIAHLFAEKVEKPTKVAKTKKNQKVDEVKQAAKEEKVEKALEILERTSAYYQELENFSATYRVTIKYPEEDMVRYDKMHITARGQQYRLSYDQKETITDGETVWVYHQALKEVTISEYDKTGSDLNFAELYNLYQQGYRSVYIGERIVHKAKNIIRDIVELTPDHEDSSFKSITLEVDRATAQIHSWEVVQNEETRYICTVCKFAVNIPLSDAYFTFDVEAHGDLEVIDLRESEEEMEDEG